MFLGSLLTTAVLVLSAVSEADAESGYWQTCNSVWMDWSEFPENSYVLVANCRQPNGNYLVGESIPLDKCFENAWGHLLPKAK